jgi:hypothetical protein
VEQNNHNHERKNGDETSGWCFMANIVPEFGIEIEQLDDTRY